MSGRGQYFKNLYGKGRGRRGNTGARGYHAGGSFATQRGGPHAENAEDGTSEFRNAEQQLGPSRGQKRRREDFRGTIQDLVGLLTELNARSYSAYRDIQGIWNLKDSSLSAEYIQNDPFAPPSKFCLRVPHANARYPSSMYDNPIRTTALCDFLARSLYTTISRLSPRFPTSSSSTSWSAAKGGVISADKPGQQVLQRSSVILDGHGIEARFTISLPAQSRTILGYEAASLFKEQVPRLEKSLMFSSHDPSELAEFIDCLVAFVINGAILPRASGISDLPLNPSEKLAVPFQSPPSLLNSFYLPHRGKIEGMGISKGVTMIAGGGFHGKSTLLDALAKGCYSHIPGDGREFVVTSQNIVSVQSEDGRPIRNVDISPFIDQLPGHVTTNSFKTEDASGSTSMAAGVIEALELGADTLLFDEDTCATNFLIRDTRMRKLIKTDPINPLVSNVRAMLRDHGCSSILVIGGCGDYCDVADLVLEMRDYGCYDITEEARRIAEEVPSVVTQYEAPTFPQTRSRHIHLPSLPTDRGKLTARKNGTVDILHDISNPSSLQETLDLRALGQLVSDSQTRAIASALKALPGIIRSRDVLHILHKQVNDSSESDEVGERQSDPEESSSDSTSSRVKQWTTLKKALRLLDRELGERGLDQIMEDGKLDPFLARPRAIEVGMAINRLASISLVFVSPPCTELVPRSGLSA
ncbi:uncharacterized protein PHACADRAFT_180634 [Phanerochaete carnosa HHB-10118-sp]|uniref:ABC transporter domain-containing protein n=1 Tax=Phanerochaete carnosa (strain HHB-10118-sp) TaxID=650164 RepID=K5WQJ8_PHACS|nr:uncharacterized protein PHACADRAFT_180634 [Phanerochaete carnosa HHB-10118-sp]EKM61524.1 hypothetical protein PHACADRAFT_180634 [Phanerochaete carnosa HHB-10118-sp]